MGINTAWVNERHEIKQEVFDRDFVLTGLTNGWFDLTNTVCLRFIDPWGDTVFNQSQIPVLLSELKAELTRQDDQRASEYLKSVIQLVELAVDQTHTYIKFIGD